MGEGEERQINLEVNWATPLYEFLRQCNASPLPKDVLDCGAGGDQPPLSIFAHHGYRTWGIELADSSLQEVKAFCRTSGLRLNIIQGNMAHLPFAPAAFSFVYSYNAIFFNSKPAITMILHEMERVLRAGGLCFVNFLSVDEPERNIYCPEARPIFGNEGFSYHEDNEADIYFANFDLLRKEKRRVDKRFEERILTQVTLEYIARKKG